MEKTRKTAASTDRTGSVRLGARPLLALLAVFLGLFPAERPSQAEQPGSPEAANDRTPQTKVDIKTIRLPVVEGTDIRFRQIVAVNGLSQTRAGSTVQDRLGFLWFGTQYGLNRFDGYRFKVFRHEANQPDSLGGVYIRSLFIDHAGTLWVGCDESFDKFDPVTETFKHFRIGPPGTDENDGPAIHISEDRYGKLWLATAKGLFRFDPTDGHMTRYTHDAKDPSSLGANNINFSDLDRQGTFWVASGGSLDAFDQQTGRVTRHIPMYDGNPFTFHEDRFGSFWIGRDSAQCPLAVLDRKLNKLDCYSIYQGARRVTGFNGIYSMLESRNGTMWMATSGAGLLKYDRSSRRLIRYQNHPEDNESLGADSVINLYEDHESNIWVDLHEAAPYSFSEKPPSFENFTHQRGQLKRSLVTSIYEDHRKILWIGSTGALNRIDRAHGINTVPPGVGANGEVLSIIEDRAGRLVAGTFWQGLQQLNPATGQATPYPSRRGALFNLKENPIMRLYIDHLGTLWAATWGGLRRFDAASGKFTTYKPDPQNSVDYSDIREDSSGRLWLGGESGLQRFDPATAQFTIYRPNRDDPHAVSDHRVTSVFLDHSGQMWLGTQNGFDRFDPNTGSAKVYYEKDGLAGNVVSCILEDERATLWMGTNNGLSNFNPVTEKFSNYSVADGLPGPDLTGWSTCFQSRDGEMFFGGFSGATAFYPGKIPSSSFAPMTVLTDFRLSGNPVPIASGSPLSRSITYTNSITLSHSQNILSIEFSALSYFNATTNRYRYKLEGLDRQWHEVGSDQRVASYTTLPKGDYTFRVEGATSRGPWGEPGASLQLRILPAWWDTWWFRAMYITLILMLIASVYFYRIHQIAHQFSLRLEERVDERTRLARDLHDTLLQTIQSTKLVADDALDEATDFTGMRLAMERLSRWLGQATDEGRAALNSLRKSTVQTTDLVESMKKATEELAGRNSLKIDFAVIGVAKEMDLLLSEEVFLIGREAIRNACLHSGADRVDVELMYTKDFVLRVSDNGKGVPSQFLDDGKPGHFGLRGMKERAARIGGAFGLDSSPASGTRITLRISGARIFYKTKK